MFELIIFRHGEDEDNERNILNGRRNTVLTDKGRAQVFQASQELGDIDAIITSPLKRALESSAIIASSQETETSIISANCLTERNFGILTGKNKGLIKHLSKKVMHKNGIDYFVEAEGVETFFELYNRVKAVLPLLLKLSGSRILLSTHGDAAMMLVALFKGLDWEEGLSQPPFKNAEARSLHVSIENIQHMSS